MEQNTTLKVTQDWNNDGFLRITGAQTIKRYNELTEKQRNIPCDKYGVFFAFDQRQFDEGYKVLVKRGLIQDGELVKSFGNGCFGVLEGMKRWMLEARAIDAQIAQECDPYEVYLYEYNNYECCIDWDGDQRAVEKVISLFGVERTKEALWGKRFRAHGTVDEIADEMKEGRA